MVYFAQRGRHHPAIAARAHRNNFFESFLWRQRKCTLKKVCTSRFASACGGFPRRAHDRGPPEAEYPRSCTRLGCATMGFKTLEPLNLELWTLNLERQTVVQL